MSERCTGDSAARPGSRSLRYEDSQISSSTSVHEVVQLNTFLAVLSCKKTACGMLGQHDLQRIL